MTLTFYDGKLKSDDGIKVHHLAEESKVRRTKNLNEFCSSSTECPLSVGGEAAVAESVNT